MKLWGWGVKVVGLSLRQKQERQNVKVPIWSHTLVHRALPSSWVENVKIRIVVSQQNESF